MEGKIPIVKYMFRKDFPVLMEVIKDLDTEVSEANSPHEVMDVLLSSNGGIVFFALHEKKDLIEIGTTLKSLRAGIKEIPLKAVVVNFTDSYAIEEKAMQLGVQDLISHKVLGKVLKFKIDFWLRAISVLTKRREEVFSLPDLELNMSERQDVEWLNSLNLENDIWLLKNQIDIKKLVDEWSVKLLGPGALLGQWVPHNDRKWSFQILGAEKELFITGRGKWFFEGNEIPEFLEIENKWVFKGKEFELYYKEGEANLSWMKSSSKGLAIRKDSAFARAKEKIIRESFNSELIKSWEVDNAHSDSFQSFLIQKNEVIPCRFDDYFDGEMSLQFIGKELLSGVEAEFFGIVGKMEKKLRLKGRVGSVNEGYANLKLDESSSELVEKIMSDLQEHQEVVDDLMKRMKGY